MPASPSAYELYLRGNQIIVQGLRGGQDLAVARDLYLRCVEEDPGYVPGVERASADAIGCSGEVWTTLRRFSLEPTPVFRKR
mgnify:CR=1 FL=1